MSTTISDVEGPVNNVIVRSRIPVQDTRSGLPEESRPSGTRDKYVHWHPGCKPKPVQHPDPCVKKNQPFTTPKAPGLRLKNPIVTRMIGRRVKLTKGKEKQSETGTKVSTTPVPIKLSHQYPWFTLDTLIGAGAGILLLALVITIVARLLG